MIRASALLLVIVTLTGCASAPPATESAVDGGGDVARSVVLCRTTLTELQLKLGAPDRDGWAGGARVVTWVVAWDPLVRYLGVVVNHEGVVVDRYWDAPSEIAWVPTDRCQRARP